MIKCIPNNNSQKDHTFTIPIAQNDDHRMRVVYNYVKPVRRLDDSYIICGKAEEVLELLPEKSFQCCVTSPLHWLPEVMPDHVHLLVSVDPQYGIHRLVKRMKGRSSRLLRQEFPWFKNQGASVQE